MEFGSARMRTKCHSRRASLYILISYEFRSKHIVLSMDGE